jgi:hypothetical protein
LINPSIVAALRSTDHGQVLSQGRPMPISRIVAVASLVAGMAIPLISAAQSPAGSERQRAERAADSVARVFGRAARARGGPVVAYNVGAMFARLGEPDSAFAWLTRAVQTGFADTATLASDADLASIRGDRRFAKIRHDASVAPAPCRDDANYRRFDFWVGNWRVTTPGGQQVGTSHVDVVSGGCALLENWRDMRGGEGKSLNTFDPATGAWRQFWVGQAGGVTDFSESEWQGTSLTFTAHTRGTNGRPDVVQRLTFTPLEGGVVRQFGQASTDGGKTWGSSYDFHYHPVK